MNVLSKLTAKGRIAAVLALGFATLFSGCKEEDPPAVSVDRPIIRTSMAEQTQPLTVISNTDWKAEITYETTGQSNWISLPRTTGRGTTDLILHIDKCTTQLMDGRQATITFTTTTSPASIATVKVRQGHDEGVLELKPDQIEVGAAEGTVKFMVESNTQWEIVGLSDWATATPTQGEGNQVITVSFDPYTSHGYDREARFMVTTTNLGAGENISKEFILTQRDQEDPTLILGQETLYFEATNADPISVPVITNTDEAPFVTPSASWCTAVWNATDKTIDVSVSDNETIDQRQCFITVIAIVDNATATKQITVTQAGMQDPKLIVTNPNVTIAANPIGSATTIDFSVGFFTEPDGLESSVTLVPGKPAWITSAAISGNASDGFAVDFVAQPNASTEMRQAAFTLKLVSAGKTVTTVITVTQNGVGDMNLTATPVSLNAVQTGETLSFSVLSDVPNVTVNVTSSKDWAVATPTVQTSTGGTIYGVSVVVDANDDADSRDAVLTVVGTLGNQTQMLTVNVNQAGTGSPQASLVRNSITVPKELGSYSVGVNNAAGVAFTCTASANWITGATFTAATNPTTGTIDFGVVANNVSATPRTAVISIIATKGGKSQQLDLEVIQLGTGSAELIISEQDITLPAGTENITYTISVQPLNGSTWSVKSYNPQTMFAGAPTTTTNTLTFVVTPNTTTTPRNANVFLIATNGDSTVPYYITITQKGLAVPEIVPVTETVHVGQAATAAGSEIKVPLINFESDITFDPLYLSDGAMFNASTTIIGYEGTSPNYTGAYLQIAVTANDKLSERTGTIKITAKRGGKPQVISVDVIQAAANAPQLIFPDVTYAYGVAALTDTRIVFLNPNDAQVAVLSAPSWIANATPAAASPAVQSYIEFDVTANVTSDAKDGYIIIEAIVGANKAQYTIFVTQAALAPIGASLASANVNVEWDIVTPTAAADKIVVNDLPTGAVVTASSSATWLTVGTIATTVPQSTIELTTTGINPRVTPRNATVTVVVTRGTEQQTLTATVVQEGAPGPVAFLITDKVEVGPNPAGAGTYPYTMSAVTFLNYNSNVTYGIPYSDAAWLSATVSNDAVVPVIASANAATETRTGTITIPVTAGGQTTTATLTVVQYGLGAPQLTMSATSLVFGPAAQAAVSYYFNNDSGATVTVLSAPAWFSNVNAANVNDGVYTFDVNENNSVYERTGTIVFKAAQGDKTATYSVAVVQNGLMPIAAYLSPTTIITGSASGVVEDIVKIFNVPAGTTVNVTSSKTWLAIPTSPSTSNNWTFTPEVTTNTTGATRFGTITVEISRGSGVTQEVVVLTMTVIQLAQDLPVPTAFLDMSEVNFDAVLPTTTPEKTVTINNTVAGYTYFVTKPDWVTVSAPSAGAPTSTFTVVPTGDNAGAQREGNVTVWVMNGNKKQELTLKVIQKGTVPVVITPTSYQVNFPATATAGTTREITLIGYNSAIHNFTASPNPGSWYTVHDPNSPMEIEVNGPWTGAAERKATVQITITNQSDGSLVSTFPITIVQDGVTVPNITYAPEVFYNVPVEGTAGSGTNVPLKTIFVNPESVPLNVINTTLSSSFISAAVFNGDVLEITVAQNTNYSTRTGQVVVSATDGSTVVKTYTITIHQDGTGAVAPAVYAQFNDGGTVYLESNPQTASPYAVDMTLAPGVTIADATVTGTPAWLTGATSTATGFSFTYSNDVFDETSTVEGVVQVDLLYNNGTTTTPFSVYYYVKYRGELPEIGATWVNNVANIEATDVSAMVTVLDTSYPAGTTATVSGVTYTGTATGWLASATGAWNDATGVFTLSGIAANTTGDARSAVVKVTFSATDHKDQVLEFVVNQAGVPITPADYEASISAVFDQAPITLSATTTAPAPFDLTTVVAGSIVVEGSPAWLDCTCPGGDDELEFTFTQNNDGVPRVARVTFKAQAPGYLPKDCSVFVVQMPEPPVDPLLTIGTLPTLAYTAGGTGVVVPYTDNGLADLGTPTTVTLYHKDDATVSEVTGVTSTQATVKAAVRNTTGSNIGCTFLLKAVNGTRTEFYEVTVQQKFMTPEDLLKLISFSQDNGTSNIVQNTTDKTKISLNASRGYNTALVRARVVVEMPTAAYVDSVTKGSDPNNVVNSPFFEDGYLKFQTTGALLGNTGIGIVYVTIKEGSASVTYTFTITVS